jgi:hypothetical protein
VLLLELDAEPIEHQLRVAGPVNTMSLGMHAVDSDVNVKVISIVMDYAHPLMFPESELIARAPLHGLQHVLLGLFARRKRQDQMVRSVSRPTIASLGVLDLEHDARDIATHAISDVDLPYPLRLPARAR